MRSACATSPNLCSPIPRKWSDTISRTCGGTSSPTSSRCRIWIIRHSRTSRAPTPQGSTDWIARKARIASATDTLMVFAASSIVTLGSRYPFSLMLPMRYSATGSSRAGSRTRTFHESHSASVCSDSARTTGSNSSSSSSRCMRLVPSRGSVSGSFDRGAFASPKQLRHTRPGRGCPHSGQTCCSSRSSAGFSCSSWLMTSWSSRDDSCRIPFAAALCVIAGLAPLLMYVALDPERSRGQALWEWSAVGGPTIQASYRLDGLAAIGVGIGALYVAAALVATTRVSARHQLLRPVILLNGLVFITLAVTDDLIADIVVLGALAALTSFIAMLVSPAAAVARITGYLAGGVQGFVVAGLLVSRFGGASFRFDTLSPDAVTPGVVVAASR